MPAPYALDAIAAATFSWRTRMIDEKPRRRLRHWVGTFETGWWHNKREGWGQYESGERSSSRTNLRSKRRSIEEAKKLADMAGSAFALVFVRINGQRLSQEIHFARKP